MKGRSIPSVSDTCVTDCMTDYTTADISVSWRQNIPMKLAGKRDRQTSTSNRIMLNASDVKSVNIRGSMATANRISGGKLNRRMLRSSKRNA